MEGKIVDSKLWHKIMKKWFYGVPVGLLLFLFVLKNGLTTNQIKQSLSSPMAFNVSDARNLGVTPDVAPVALSPQAFTAIVPSADIVTSSLFVRKNFSQKVQISLQTWHFMEHIVDFSRGLPNGVEAIREAGFAWDSLVNSLEKNEMGDENRNMPKLKGKQCPHFLTKLNATEFGDKGYNLRMPCGLVQGSSITVIGIPSGLLGNFQIDLIGEPLSEDPNPPIFLHYNVRLNGDIATPDPVIVQNTWTSSGWGDEERCPSSVPGNNKKVDQLNQCNLMVAKNDTSKPTVGGSSNFTKPRQYFPFKQRNLSVLTLRVGEEGVHMTVDGKHTTSFAIRERLEPWLVNEVRVSGDFELISVFASGLPTSEDQENFVDHEALSSGPLALHTPLDLFIGVFSTANNFKRRMSVRRTWMQYAAVTSGAIAVRFFVGLHKNQMVNEELWNEVETYGDIQLMPFIDYYDLITWKTLATCIFGTQVVSAKYVMKTDDDSFIRVDEVMASLERANVSEGLLYGRISSSDRPQRDPDSKWYISHEEWPEETYPPWAHGPGYVVSQDIANAIYSKHERGELKMFKLEDVAMGIWIAELKKKGLQVSYVNEQRIHIEGCKEGYVIAHYQSPRRMLCLWQKLQEGKGAKCCDEL